ncbi:MAG: hypothetical protein U1F67_09605 [Rubrivivax sp.]
MDAVGAHRRVGADPVAAAVAVREGDLHLAVAVVAVALLDGAATVVQAQLLEDGSAPCSSASRSARCAT